MSGPVEGHAGEAGIETTDRLTVFPKQLLDLGCEGVLAVVACTMKPPHGPCAVLAGQCVQHRQDRGGSHSGADQHDRAGLRAQRALQVEKLLVGSNRKTPYSRDQAPTMGPGTVDG